MEEIKGLVSIIIPVYNRQNVIEECIRSVLAQSYPNFEVIVVDDGSTDSTLDICKKLAENEPRIKLLSGEHGGVSAARNMALDAATGEYVFFLDSDDVIHTQLLETLYTGMESAGASIGGTTICHIPEQYWNKVDQLRNEKEPVNGIAFHRNSDAIDGLMLGKLPLAVIGGKIMLRSLIGNTRFRTDLHISEDYLFIYENLTKGADCLTLSHKWYFVRVHNNSLSRDYSFDGFWSRFYRRELVWNKEVSYGRNEYADLQKQDAFNCYLRCIVGCKGNRTDLKKMRSVMRKYKSQLMPALSVQHKLLYLLSLYFPAIATKVINKRK
jgi:glycosyltransferase involved in cell wall biosynthesis